jgi:choline kinase
LFLAADLMNSNQSALVAYGNIIYDATVLQTLLSSRDPLAVVTDIAWEQYWKARMDDPLQDVESFRWDPATRKIFELGGKPGTLEEIQGQFIGLFKIDRDYVKTFKQMYLLFCQEHSDAGKARITDFLNYLIEKQQPIFGVPVYNQWAEFNIPRDLEFNADF